MRDFNRGDRRGGGGRSFGGPRDGGRPTMHEAICANCGQTCQVPFRPTGEKPVFCNNCFRGKSDSRDSRGGPRSSAPRNDGMQRQIDEINAKLDRILTALKA